MTDGGAAIAAGVLTPEQAAQVLARVGDRTITLGDFEPRLEHMDQFDRMRYQAPERRKELLGEMIDVMLLADEAREQGLRPGPGHAAGGPRDPPRRHAQEGARRRPPARNEIPADEVRAYFDAHQADFHDPERRRVAAIVLAPPTAAAQHSSTALQGAGASQWGELVRTQVDRPQAKANAPLDLAGRLGLRQPPRATPRRQHARAGRGARRGLHARRRSATSLPSRRSGRQALRREAHGARPTPTTAPSRRPSAPSA